MKRRFLPQKIELILISTTTHATNIEQMQKKLQPNFRKRRKRFWQMYNNFKKRQQRNHMKEKFHKSETKYLKKKNYNFGYVLFFNYIAKLLKKKSF